MRGGPISPAHPGCAARSRRRRGLDAMTRGDIDALLGEVERFVGSVNAEQATFERVLRDSRVHRRRPFDREGGRVRGQRVEDTRRAAPHSRSGHGRAVSRDRDRHGRGRILRDLRRSRSSCALRPGDRRGVQPMGLEIRAGVHTGEVEVIDQKVGGIAVNIGARAGRARPSDVLVSQTVKDLVAGWPRVRGRGRARAEGVPDRWRLYRAIG